MTAAADTLALVAAIALGLMAGALLAEGAILVSFWKLLPPEEFLSWYRRHGALLLRFFGPLEVAAALLAIAAAAVHWLSGSAGRHLLVLSALLAVAVLAVFPLYFQRVNASFAAATIPVDRVASELRRWSSWHCARTLIATAGFVAALVALNGE